MHYSLAKATLIGASVDSPRPTDFHLRELMGSLSLKVSILFSLEKSGRRMFSRECPVKATLLPT